MSLTIRMSECQHSVASGRRRRRGDTRKQMAGKGHEAQTTQNYCSFTFPLSQFLSFSVLIRVSCNGVQLIKTPAATTQGLRSVPRTHRQTEGELSLSSDMHVAHMTHPGAPAHTLINSSNNSDGNVVTDSHSMKKSLEKCKTLVEAPQLQKSHSAALESLRCAVRGWASI